MEEVVFIRKEDKRKNEGNASAIHLKPLDIGHSLSSEYRPTYEGVPQVEEAVLKRSGK